ncbi:hypothetical protein BGZ65_000231 [Modicella reniformis]|uniref:Uncharacterized protein n=1 Tax=Modicella reniformis TaxID=1440133 RepID=A0A9P6MAB9_9FUNG|nr:hypothetical protein BGZ65_000231 [Modicella reniformis]
MHFKSLASVAITLAALAATFVQASPLPRVQGEASALAVDEHTTLAKRSSAGWNNWNCKPSAAHPRALVLVHGLLANGVDNWLYMAPRFVIEGYCVYTVDYGQLNSVPIIYGLDKMENSAQQLSDFVNKVLAATGTTQVDMFGHSQGSLMPRYYLKYLGGGPKVHKFATIGSIQYGTDLLGLVKLLEPLGLYDPLKKTFDSFCLSCFQLLTNSTFIQNLNDGGDTVPGVEYLMIVSKYDEIVTPYKTGFLRDNNPKVRNQVLQDWCPLDLSEHALQFASPVVFNAVHAFFTPTADQTINCVDLLHK